MGVEPARKSAIVVGRRMAEAESETMAGLRSATDEDGKPKMNDNMDEMKG